MIKWNDRIDFIYDHINQIKNKDLFLNIAERFWRRNALYGPDSYQYPPSDKEQKVLNGMWNSVFLGD